MRSSAEIGLTRAARWLVLPALLALALGCGPNIKHVDLYGKDPEHVWLQYAVEKGGQVIPQGYQHPSTLTAEQVDSILGSVHFAEHSFFAWRDQGPVFIEDERKKLAPWLADALSRATPDQWVYFAVTSMKRDLLFKTKRLSDAICFIKDGKFNLVVANLNFELAEPEKDFFRLDPRERTLFNSQRLTAAPEKGIEVPPIVVDDKYLKTAHRNWVTIDTAKLFAALAKEPKPAAAATPPPTPAAAASAGATPATPAPASAASPPTAGATPPPPTPAAATSPPTVGAAPSPPTPASAPMPAAGGPTVQPAPASAPPAIAAPAVAPADQKKGDVEERLRKLQDLLDKGLITKEEYDKKRQEILNSL